MHLRLALTQRKSDWSIFIYLNPALYLGESSKYEINKELDSACQYSTAGSPSLCNEYSLGVYETQHLPTALVWLQAQELVGCYGLNCVPSKIHMLKS